MKATTAQFVDADSAQKERLLIDGIKFITDQMKDASDNMRRLNTWLKCFNALVGIGEVNPTLKNELQNRITEFENMHDDFTDHSMCVSIIMYSTAQKLLKKVK